MLKTLHSDATVLFLPIPNLEQLVKSISSLDWKEKDLLENATRDSSNGYKSFLRLLDHAELEASHENLIWKRLMLLLGRRWSVILFAHHADTGNTLKMHFSFPKAMRNAFETKAIDELLVLSTDQLCTELCSASKLVRRLQADLRVFKIMLNAAGLYSPRLRLVDLGIPLSKETLSRNLQVPV